MTTTLTNISPQGDLELPLLNRVVAAGETIEVTAEVGRLLEDQRGTWLVADSDPTIDDLRQIAEHRGIDIKGLRKKAEIQAAIAAASVPPSQVPELGDTPADDPAPVVSDPTTPETAPADRGAEPSQGDTSSDTSGDDTDPEEGEK